MRKRPLLQIACVFLTGLAYQRYSDSGLLIVGILSILWECRIGRKTKNLRRAAGRSMLLLSAFFLGIFHMWQECEFRAAYMSKITDGSRVTVWGELIKWETTEYGYRGILSDCYIDSKEGIIPSNDIMVYTSNDQYETGQVYKINGKVNMFSKAPNYGNFDMQTYYQSMKIDFAVDEEESVAIGEGLDTGTALLFSLREKINSVYEKAMSGKAAGFYQAMILGNKINLDDALKSLFLLGGISHILAISGLHVSVLGRGLYRILRHSGGGFFISGVIGGTILVLYGIMVGNTTSTVRAVGMMLLFFTAQWIGRSYDLLNALGGMVLLLLWENPFLIENTGFWFSVTALLGVGFVGKEMWMNFGIVLATLPITAISYYEVPVYSPIVNFVVLPLLPPVFCLAVVGGLLGALFPEAGVLVWLFKPCEWLLYLYEGICVLVSKLPWANVICGKPEWWQVMVYYGILFGGICLIRIIREQSEKIKNTRFDKSFILHFLLICICGLCIFFPKAKPFEITFLDVGQGDGIYISGGDGTTYFIDGGSSNVPGVGEYRILPFLKAKGVNKIDYWFISHCDTDHISGLLEMLENGYKIEHIVSHEQCSNKENRKAIIEKATENAVEVLCMKAGHQVCSKNIQIRCLAPLSDDSMIDGGDENENSLVLALEWKNKQEEFRALFAGDISAEAEQILCEKGVLMDVDLVKANHHGSNYSNSTNWLECLKPEYIVVSCGKNNRYGHPGTEAVGRMEAGGAEIFYTMEGGQITFPLIQ